MEEPGSRPPGPPRYNTPDECESAFYGAFRSGDLELMDSVWVARGRIVCIHPGRPPLAGREAVMRSWTEIFSATGGVHIRFDCHDRVQAGSLAVHLGLEIVGPQTEEPALVTVTNVYELTAGGWRMRVHHTAPIHAGAGRRMPLH
jgi:ketosteroid isomerase-like protein